MAAEDLLKVLKPIAVRRWRAALASARYDAKPKANRRSVPDEQSEVRQEIERTSRPGAPSVDHGAPRAQESDEAIGADTDEATGEQEDRDQEKRSSQRSGTRWINRQANHARCLEEVQRHASRSGSGVEVRVHISEVFWSWSGRRSDSSVAMLRVRQMRLLCVRQDGRGLRLLPL